MFRIVFPNAYCMLHMPNQLPTQVKTKNKLIKYSMNLINVEKYVTEQSKEKFLSS